MNTLQKRDCDLSLFSHDLSLSAPRDEYDDDDDTEIAIAVPTLYVLLTQQTIIISNNF